MKKNILLLATLLLLCSASFAQTLYRTYYDYEKQHVHEEYYANSYGVKNGTYKEYSEYGGVLQEGTYKDDKKVGKWITRTEQGKLDKIENYKDDKLNGPWTSYYYDDGAKYKEGNFKDGDPIGNWCLYIRYNDYIYIGNYIRLHVKNDSIYNFYYDVPKSAIVGNEYVKVLVHYSYSSAATSDNSEQDDWGNFDYGHIINKYYPSGNKCQEGHYTHSVWIGDYYQYYPNGKLEGFWENDTINGRTLFSKEWRWPGGSKDSIPFYKKAESAERHVQDSLSNIENAKQKRSQDSVLKAYQDQMALQQRKGILNHRVDSLYAAYKNLYMTNKQATLLGVPLVDQKTHQPVMKTIYPHGEYLFEKSDTLIKNMLVDYNHTSDIGSQIAKLNSMTVLINKLISMTNTDTKDIDKQMKKAETIDDIKKILDFEY